MHGTTRCKALLPEQRHRALLLCTGCHGGELLGYPRPSHTLGTYRETDRMAVGVWSFVHQTNKIGAVPSIRWYVPLGNTMVSTVSETSTTLRCGITDGSHQGQAMSKELRRQFLIALHNRRCSRQLALLLAHDQLLSNSVQRTHAIKQAHRNQASASAEPRSANGESAPRCLGTP